MNTQVAHPVARQNAMNQHAQGVKPSVVPFAHPAGDNPAHYSVNVPGGMEKIYQPLYDILNYPAAGTAGLTFYQRTVGSGGTTLSDTNMAAQGALPQPQQFMIHAISVDWYPGTEATALPVTYGAGAANGAINDMVKVFRYGGYAVFTIGTKQYLQLAPLSKLPSRTAFDFHAAASDTTTAGAGQQWRAQAPYIRGPMFHVTPMLIPPMQNWNLQLVWPTLIPLGTSSSTTYIGVTLYGELYRAIQ